MAAPLAAASKRDQKANGGAVDCICLAVDNDHGRIGKPLREFFRRDTMKVRSHTRGRGRRRQLSLIAFAAFAGAMLASWPIPARAADPNEFIVWSDPNLRGRPKDHVLHVREVRLSAGAGFLVALTGDVLTMPGLPKPGA